MAAIGARRVGCHKIKAAPVIPGRQIAPSARRALHSPGATIEIVRWEREPSPVLAKQSPPTWFLQRLGLVPENFCFPLSLQPIAQLREGLLVRGDKYRWREVVFAIDVIVNDVLGALDADLHIDIGVLLLETHFEGREGFF